MPYYAGIDGGQTTTTAVVGDESGKILGRGEAGPADEIGQGPESTRLRDALQAALSEAMSRANLPADTQLERVVAGVSGYEGHVYGQSPALPARAFAIVHDSEIAHAGALAGDYGVVVIAGTGSVAFGKGERGTSFVGGWGYVFGDEGSGFWFTREALAQAMRDFDAGVPNDITPLALKHFAKRTLRELARAFYANEISRAKLAHFGVELLAAAQRGNARAAELVQKGAVALVTLAVHAAVRAGLPADTKVAFTGGVKRSPTVRAQIAQCMHSMLPNAQLAPPKYDAATGALIMAYRASGMSPEITP
ncbi:MAG TPA: BadF/BadG/BcrA/BcrD ATPase family protein [Candidatus Baltobacteraceae bacterium]|jgi:N-acetylglucosamine kinase-like BadF-type ATPase|nr:BadF/BadG/BcrA/BcrD ATPase family protein [Candidatus Baltobacteraceae bacterium]